MLFQAYNKIEDRENELTKLVNGEISAKRKPRRTKAIKKRAFNEYLKLFYDQPKVPVSYFLLLRLWR